MYPLCVTLVTLGVDWIIVYNESRDKMSSELVASIS